MDQSDRPSKPSKIDKMLEKYKLSPRELETIIKSQAKKPTQGLRIEVGKPKFRYLYISDTHIGHEKFHVDLFEKAALYAKQYSVDFILHPGDHLEGMSGRPGHIYELTHIGFHKQIEYAAQLYQEFGNKPIFGIDGNHDGWYEDKNSAGVIVGRELETRLKHFKHLGQMEGNLEVDGVHIMLYHGADGTAYADSYKIQKLIESFTGGQKPNIVHSGHYHKHLTDFKRNVWGMESGTLMGQSRFMRGKKLEAAMGFGVVTVCLTPQMRDLEVEHRWVPYFEKEKTIFGYTPPTKLGEPSRR